MNYSHMRDRRWRLSFSFSFSRRDVSSHSKHVWAVMMFILVCMPGWSRVSAQLTASDLIPSTAYFSQDFSSSTVIADYVSVAPNSGQFNSIGTTGAGMVVSITAGRLQYTRTATNSGSFSRTTDFAPIPSTLKYSFDLTVSGNAAAQTTAATFQVGSAFSTSNSLEPTSNVFSRFGINFTAADGQWSARDIGASTNSANFTGTQTVSWFINNSDSIREYLAPDGSTDSLADNTADLWIGTTRVFNDYAATTPTQILTDIKFVFAAGAGSIQIDNIQIDDIATPTLAAVSIAGRVTDPLGNPVRDAIILLEGSLLERPRTARVNTFGYYRFEGVHVGTYNLTVNSRRATFAVRTRTLTLHDNVTDADFVSEAAP